jgi:leader peptidase (prepilin peptidase)/N-methyltransferase
MTSGILYIFYLTGLAGFGLIFGSFLNVVAYRVPIGMNLSHPPSTCPSCKKAIAAYDNVPLLSWMFLRGKCRHCRNPIPDRYPLVEFLTSATWVTLGLWAWQPGQITEVGTQASLIDPLLPLLLAMASMGIALWLIDLDHLRLPDALVLPQYLLAVIGLLFAGYMTGGWPITRALMSAGVWLLVFGGIWLGTLGKGMGFGDVKLAPVLGLVLGWIGWGPSVVGIFLGFVLGGLFGIILIVQSKAKRKTRIPYGPFLLAGAFLGLLIGEIVWDWYLNLMGLG